MYIYVRVCTLNIKHVKKKGKSTSTIVTRENYRNNSNYSSRSGSDSLSQVRMYSQHLMMAHRSGRNIMLPTYPISAI